MHSSIAFNTMFICLTVLMFLIVASEFDRSCLSLFSGGSHASGENQESGGGGTTAGGEVSIALERPHTTRF